jgi:hypothetical protein
MSVPEYGVDDLWQAIRDDDSPYVQRCRETHPGQLARRRLAT